MSKLQHAKFARRDVLPELCDAVRAKSACFADTAKSNTIWKSAAKSAKFRQSASSKFQSKFSRSERKINRGGGFSRVRFAVVLRSVHRNSGRSSRLDGNEGDQRGKITIERNDLGANRFVGRNRNFADRRNSEYSDVSFDVGRRDELLISKGGNANVKKRKKLTSMAEQKRLPIICRNGHQQPNPDSKFCIYCGTALNVPQTAPNQNPNVPQQNQFNAGTQPPPNNFQQQQYHQNFQPQVQQQQIQQYQNQPPVNYIQPSQCYTCGGNGRGLEEKTLVCKECRWLRPLVPGYGIDVTAFQWAADGKAMNALRAIKPLNAAAKAVSEKVGRRWIESTFNSVLLGENQLPEIYAQAVKAARIIGMSNMPDIYLSGERAWDCLTFGTDKDSFVIIGSALAGNFQGDEMLFLLAREMGHCRVGHALWNTVTRFLLGEQGQQKGIMSGGIFNAILNPAALIEGAIEVPLLAWARQSEITADRAGLLTVGDEQIARRVLLTWSLKSAFMYKQINIEAWLEQQAADDNNFSKLSELTTSSTPYITRRLKLLNEFAGSPDLQRWRGLISGFIKQTEPPLKQSAPPVEQTAPTVHKPKPPTDDKEILKVKCATCQTPMRVPLKVLEGKKELPVKCPNKQCGQITRLKKNVKPAQKIEAAKPSKIEENLNYGD